MGWDKKIYVYINGWIVYYMSDINRTCYCKLIMVSFCIFMNNKKVYKLTHKIIVKNNI